MTPRELANAMRAGAKLIKASGNFYEKDDNSGCAICCLMTGITGSTEGMWNETVGSLGNYIKAAAKLADIPSSLALDIEKTFMHNGNVSYQPVIDWLESLDTAKLSDREQFDKFMQSTLEPVEVIA